MGNGLLRFPLPQYPSTYQRSLVYRLVSSDLTSAAMDQCICLHGSRAHGLQLHRLCKDLTSQGVEIWSHLRPTRHLVRIDLSLHVPLRTESANEQAAPLSSKPPARPWPRDQTSAPRKSTMVSTSTWAASVCNNSSSSASRISPTSSVRK